MARRRTCTPLEAAGTPSGPPRDSAPVSPSQRRRPRGGPAETRRQCRRGRTLAPRSLVAPLSLPAEAAGLARPRDLVAALPRRVRVRRDLDVRLPLGHARRPGLVDPASRAIGRHARGGRGLAHAERLLALLPRRRGSALPSVDPSLVGRAVLSRPVPGALVEGTPRPAGALTSVYQGFPSLPTPPRGGNTDGPVDRSPGVSQGGPHHGRAARGRAAPRRPARQRRGAAPARFA